MNKKGELEMLAVIPITLVIVAAFAIAGIAMIKIDHLECKEQLNDSTAWGDANKGGATIRAHLCCTSRQKIVGEEIISYDYCEAKR